MGPNENGNQNLSTPVWKPDLKKRAENPHFFPWSGVVGSLSRTSVECGKVCGHSETRVSERVTCREKEIPASFCYGQ